MSEIEQRALYAASRVLPDKVWAEARKRLMADMTGADFEDHLIRVAAEHAARIALSPGEPS